MSKKDWLKGGASKGLGGIGTAMGLSALGPWGVLILLAIVVIGGLVFWAWLALNGLTTAFAGFVGGLILIWFGSNLLPAEHRNFSSIFKLLLIPVVLGVVGYIVEKLNIWRVPFTVTLPTKSLMFATDMIVTLDTLLLFIIAFCVVAQLAITIVRKYK